MFALTFGWSGSLGDGSRNSVGNIVRNIEGPLIGVPFGESLARCQEVRGGCH
jgi:hypothetical protein